MLSGVLNDDNFAEVLRTLSQRRSSGVLELTCPNGMVQISFAQGKIVDARESWCNCFEVLRSKIRAAGYELPSQADSIESYAELLPILPEQSLSPDLFKLVVKYHILEVLYRLDLKHPVPYEFRPRAAVKREECSPSLSTGQLLLDLASKEQVQAEFNQHFKMNERVSCTDIAAQYQCREEELVYQLLVKPLVLEDLLRVSLLGVYQTQSVLLALYQRGLVKSEEFPQKSAQDGELGETPVAVRETEDQPGSCPIKEADMDQQEEVDLPGSSIRIGRVDLLNAKLLHQAWPARLVLYVFLIFALFAPFLWWGEIFEKFGYF
ncbi:MAG: DUF4388 domain-containing protein [Deltaproteobacteria bacterium]|nr:DUF4388 domain-containing protein [Deltaproteobacteria bacterium]